MTGGKADHSDNVGVGGACVHVVDDDPAVRESLSILLQSRGYRVRVFADTQELWSAFPLPRPTCLVLDVHLPGETGIQSHRRMRQEELDLPVIFLTGNGDVPSAVEAMRQGAVDYALKPVHPAELLKKVAAAIEEDKQRLSVRQEGIALQTRMSTLLPEERAVYDAMKRCRNTKAAAEELGVSVRTVQLRLARIRSKLDLADIDG